MLEDTNKELAIEDDNKELLGKKIKSIPIPDSNISGLSDLGIADKIADMGTSSKLDISKINSFTQIAQSRDQLYMLLDVMSNDPTVAAVIETYAEDATEYNEEGRIIWAESEDSNTGKYINYLLKSLQVDKNAYKWIYSLCKYGDIYLQLYKQSEYNKDPFFKDINKKIKKQTKEDIEERKTSLKEDIAINVYNKNDHLVHYIEMEPNPAILFDLTKFGKTAGYIKTDINSISKNKDNVLNTHYLYHFKKDDINIYNSDKFVHGALEDNTSRVPEKVEIFLKENDGENNTNSEYTVRRGQSLLYNVFKIWRELSLLENSLLLNRVTKSSIIRVVNVEIGDMPKEDVRGYLAGIKSLMEQKTSLDENSNMTEYTNPGPIENNIYVPTKDGQGVITTSQVGGEVNVGQLPDVDYFTNKYYGALRIPKQFFGFTDDAAGFNGGSSLSIISSRYAKMIKRIQNTLIQTLQDVINLFLIDKGMASYIGKFNLKMQPPTTQEEIDRRDNVTSKMAIVSDVMNLLTDVNDNNIKLKILKSLLSNTITDNNVISLLDEEIDKAELVENGESENKNGTLEDRGLESDIGEPLNLNSTLGLGDDEELNTDLETEYQPSELSPDEEEQLPTPEELGGNEIDFTQNQNF